MKILITEQFSDNAIQTLKNEGFKVDTKTTQYETLRSIIKEYDGLIIKLAINIDKELLSSSRLKFIATPTTGVDHIDLKEAKKLDIQIISLKNERKFLKNITSTAELTFGLILCLLRKIHSASQSVNKNEWERDNFIGNELRGKTIGIMGLGRLGKIVAKIGESFHANIIYYDPYVESRKYKKVNLDELASKSDIISIHASLTEETKHLINYEFLKKCKPSCLIINTSRGNIINEDALLDALAEKVIAGAGLDVLENEVGKKKIYNGIIEYAKHHNNVLITPHIGGATREGMEATQMFIVNKIIKKYGSGKK